MDGLSLMGITIKEKEKMIMSESPPPSWKKLKRKLREKSEADGPFQEGDYDDDSEEFDYEPCGEPD